nr:CapA family protein [Glutamicibacter sp. JC586]
MVTGDVLLHPQLLDEAKTAAQSAGGNGKDFDFAPLLEGLTPYAQDADVALCNLETPIGTEPYSGYPRFTVPAQILSDLKDVGYDGCTTATNHTVDAGTGGVNRTLDALQDQGLFATGSYRTQKDSQKPSIMDVEGVKLGVVASTYSLNGLAAASDWQVDTGVDTTRLISRAKAAKKAGAQIVVAAIHDGTEYTDRPSIKQRELGQTLAESGAFNLIYMHHTHSVLPIEKHDGTWIVYGLGNSVAKHATPTILNREGISVKATFGADAKTGAWEVSNLQWVPHQLSTAPVKWCQVFEPSQCLPAKEAKASLARTTETVDAYGAIDDGLKPWKVD